MGQTTSTQAIRLLSVLGFRSVSRTWQSLAARAWLHPHPCPRSWTSECLPKCVCEGVGVCVEGDLSTELPPMGPGALGR